MKGRLNPIERTLPMKTNKRHWIFIVLLLITLLPFPASHADRSNYYCKNCGAKYPTVQSMSCGICHKNPEGGKRHELYEGSEKREYVCKNCGAKYPTLASMSSGICHRNPEGGKRHEPYEGSEKREYVCKNCGAKYPTLASMSSGICHKDPRGKKRHSPSL